MQEDPQASLSYRVLTSNIVELLTQWPRDASSASQVELLQQEQIFVSEIHDHRFIINYTFTKLSHKFNFSSHFQKGARR